MAKDVFLVCFEMVIVSGTMSTWMKIISGFLSKRVRLSLDILCTDAYIKCFDRSKYNWRSGFKVYQINACIHRLEIVVIVKMEKSAENSFTHIHFYQSLSHCNCTSWKPSCIPLFAKQNLSVLFYHTKKILHFAFLKQLHSNVMFSWFLSLTILFMYCRLNVWHIFDVM